MVKRNVLKFIKLNLMRKKHNNIKNAFSKYQLKLKYKSCKK